MMNLSQIRSQHWYTSIHKISHFTVISLVFPYCYFSILASHPWDKALHLDNHIFSVSSGLWHFLRPSLFLLTLRAFRNNGRLFCRMPINLGFLDLFLIVRLGLWFLIPQRWSAILKSHHFKTCCHCDITNDVNFHHLANVMFARFLHYI